MDDMELILQALQTLNGRLDSMDTKLEQMDDRLGQMDDKMDQLIEDHSITRDGVNALLDWADECGRVVKFPLPNVK